MRPLRGDGGVCRQGDGDRHVHVALFHDGSRDVEHGVKPVVAGDLHDHPAGGHHLARFGTDDHDGAGRVGEKEGVVQPALGDAKLRARRIGCRLAEVSVASARSRPARARKPRS
jgi:hypothetical protein